MGFVIVIVLLIVNIPIYKWAFNLIFKSMDDFYESLRYVFTPDMFSLFRGEYVKDWFGEMKFHTFILLCGGAVFFEYALLSSLLKFIGIRIS